MVLSFVGLPTSTYYDYIKRENTESSKDKPVKTGRPILGFSKTKTGEKITDLKTKSLILEYIEGDSYAAGYHTITHYLRDDMNIVINHKKVYRFVKN